MAKKTNWMTILNYMNDHINISKGKNDKELYELEL